MSKRKIILASASPRRSQLLSDLGLEFEVVASDVDENIDMSIKPDMFVRQLALLKATQVSKAFLKEDAIIIAADTVVVQDDKILGKPKDELDAFNMLKSLSGRTHMVYTGVCVGDTSIGEFVAKSKMTKVFFKNLSDELIKTYINTKEPMDKAGAYGIQGYGTLLVDYIEGDYFNVVGLPLGLLDDMLKDFRYTIL